MKIHIESVVKCPVRTVIDHFGKELFTHLKPPVGYVELIRFDGSHTGDIIELKVHLPGQTQHWINRIDNRVETGSKMSFTDVGETLPPPLSKWTHTHTIEAVGIDSTRIIDHIEFKAFNVLWAGMIYLPIWTLFRWRRHQYRFFFEEYIPNISGTTHESQ